jgi:DnaJ-class molecular chaperone
MMARKRKMQGKTRCEGFNPEKYGMILCPQCNGRGKVFKDAKELNVCVVCGGFGAIKAPKGEPIDGWPLVKHEN